MTPMRIILFLGILLFSFPVTAQFLNSFQLNNPADNSVIILNGNENDALTFNWGKAYTGSTPGTIVSYALHLDTPQANILAPLEMIPAANLGDTFITRTKKVWASLLDDASQRGFGKKFFYGDTLVLHGNVLAAGVQLGPVYDYRLANATRTVTFIRGIFNQELIPFQIKNPSFGATVNVGGSPAQNIRISWSASGCPVSCGLINYQIYFDSINSDFSKPIFLQSAATGDSFANIGFDDLAGMADMQGAKFGEIKQVYFKIEATGNGRTLWSSNTGLLYIQRNLFEYENLPFNLLSPSDGFKTQLGGKPMDDIVFRWNKTETSAPNVITYTIEFDTVGLSGVFANPLFSMNSVNLGLDSFLAVSKLDLRNLIDNALGDKWFVLPLKWVAKARSGGFTFLPENDHSIEFTRGIFNSVNLVNNKNISVYPNPATDIVFVESLQDEFVSFEIKDINGKTVLQQKETEPFFSKKIDLKSIPAGVYILILKSGSQQEERLKFIKQ